MSPRSTYLRVQADKCRSHTLSMSMGDVVTQAALRKLADEYIAQAEEIEKTMPPLTTAHPLSAALWLPSNSASAVSFVSSRRRLTTLR